MNTVKTELIENLRSVINSMIEDQESGEDEGVYDSLLDERDDIKGLQDLLVELEKAEVISHEINTGDIIYNEHGELLGEVKEINDPYFIMQDNTEYFNNGTFYKKANH